MNATWDELQRSLEQFMTGTAARVVLRSAVDACHLAPESLTRENLPRLVTALIPAAHHFVDATKREPLRAHLHTLLRRGDSTKPVMLTVRTEQDASRARLEARVLCMELGAAGLEAQKVATAVSELARNQISYAGGGTLEIKPLAGPPRRVQVVAQDHGPGITGIEEILAGKYQSKHGLGLGILGVKRLADRFDIKTGPAGTRVEFEVML